MIAILLFPIFLLLGDPCMARKEMNFIRLATCPEYKNYTIIFQNVVFTKNKHGKSTSMKFAVVFKKEVKRPMVMVTLQKCDDSGNLDTCEYYTKDVKINNVCEVMGQQNMMWTEILSNSNFPKSCPIPAGRYHLNDTQLDNDMQWSLMPIPTALWKIRFFTYDSGNHNVMACCTDLELKVYNSRQHSA